jgi:hypothetical protein
MSYVMRADRGFPHSSLFASIHSKGYIHGLSFPVCEYIFACVEGRSLSHYVNTCGQKKYGELFSFMQVSIHQCRLAFIQKATGGYVNTFLHVLGGDHFPGM